MNAQQIDALLRQLADKYELAGPSDRIPAGEERAASEWLALEMEAAGATVAEIEAELRRLQGHCAVALEEELLSVIIEDMRPVTPCDPPGRTDLGNAMRFVEQHREEIRYLAPGRKWLLWDGRRWAPDERNAVMALARQTAKSIWAEAAAADDPIERKAIGKWAAGTESAARLDAMVRLASSDPAVVVIPDDLDRDPWAFNVRNGTLDLHTGELREHRRDDLITKLADIDFDRTAACPRWRQFLFEVFCEDEDLFFFLQRAIGYSMIGERKERAMLLLHGTGSNGKSVLLETLLALFGDYGAATPPETLLAKKGDTIPNDLARLLGVRLCVAAETGDGRRFDAARLKALTGRDTICARFMRAEWFSFKPTFQLWLATNHRPTCDGSDRALFDRIKLVPFERRFEEAEQDKELAAKLAAELPGILGWAVAGALMWLEDGLAAPEAVTSATAQYRSEMDAVRRFLDDCAELTPGGKTTAKALYARYKTWAEAQGEYALSQRKLGERLARLGLTASKGTGGTRQWQGLELV